MVLSEYLRRATDEHWAVPHFNVATSAQIRAIALAAQDVGSPVMIGTSEREAEHLGWSAFPLYISELSRTFGVPLIANADHMKSIETAKKALESGYESVICDLSKLSEEQNVHDTAEFVVLAHEKGTKISVEGEFGVIVTDSSKVYDNEVIVPHESLTKPEEARTFVELTGVNRFAAAVGTIHGIAANKPSLDLERIAAIRKIIPTSVAFVLHGGSGVSDEGFVSAIKAGISNVHVSTSLRIAYRNGLEDGLRDNPHEVAPYTYEAPAVEAMRVEARRLMTLFGSAGKA